MYTSKTKVAYLFGIDEANIKDEWIEWAEAEVDTLTNLTFKTQAVVKKYDGTGNDELILDEYPIISITKIEYLYQYQPTEVWEELISQYYRLYADRGIIKLTPDLSGLSDISEFEEGVQNWKITYSYGSATTPKIVELLASLLIGDLYYKSTGETGSISSERIGAYSVSFSDVEKTLSIPDMIKSIVDQIKKSKTTLKEL